MRDERARQHAHMYIITISLRSFYLSSYIMSCSAICVQLMAIHLILE